MRSSDKIAIIIILQVTALLRLSNLKNSSDSNEKCVPWFTTVPSITYIWTRRPQWRRRHKNRKKVKAIPATFIHSGAREDKTRYFWETRPCSRSSTSPYETCSSRQILTESELLRNSSSQRNREVFMSKKKNRLANRKLLVCETHSDSRLQNHRGTKLLGSIRSQKRLGVGNSANGQNTVGTLSSLEVNRSVQLLVCKALQSDNSLPKRRVTFSNYVPENSVTDTRSQISSIIMNDNEASDTSWSRRSNVRLSDDEDNCSMQTDLSCLISSINFDDSKSSFFSLTSGKSSENHKKSNSVLNSELNDTFFYVNSSYSNGSSCNLLSLSNNFSSDDFKKTHGSSSIQQNCSNDFGKKTLGDKLNQSSLQFNEIVPLFKIPENVTTETVFRPTSCIVDDAKEKIAEKPKQSNLLNDIVSGFKRQEEITTETMYGRNSGIVDVMRKKIGEKMGPSSQSNEIKPVIKSPEDVTINTMYRRSKKGDDFMRHQWGENWCKKNKMATDIRIVEEINPKLTSNQKPCVVDVMTNKLKDSLSQLSQTNNIISVKTPEDITTGSMYSRTLLIVDAMKKQLGEKLTPTNYMDPFFKTPEDITTESLNSQSPHTNDLVKHKWRESLIESNQIVSDIIKAEEIKTELAYSHTSYKVDVMNKKLEERFSQSKPLNDISPVFQKSEKIPTRLMYTRIPHSDDFSKNRWSENLMESNKKNVETQKDEETKTEIKKRLCQSSLSNKIVPVFKKTEDIINEPIYCRTRRSGDSAKNQWKDNWFDSNQIVPDITVPAKTQSDPKNNSIECITIELKDISSSFKEIVIESRLGSDNEDYASMPKNDIATDTSDLIDVNRIPSLDPKAQLVNNDADNGILSIREIFNFLQQPPEALDASLLFEELTTVPEQPFRNYDAVNELSYVGRKESKKNVKEIVDQVELFRIDTETCGEYESVFIEMKDFCDDFEKNEILEKRSSLQFRNCFQEPCGSLVRNLNGSSKHSELVESSTSHCQNEYAKCSAGGKCCLVCGRRNIDNPRYIRPVCRVKGGNWSPHSEKDPWMNVMKKVVKYDNRMEVIPQTCTIPKNEEISEGEKITEESSKKSVSNGHQTILNESPTAIEKKSENIVKNEEKECLSVIITEAEEPSISIPPVETNIPSRADQSTSCCPPELHSSTSFGFATFRGPRTQSAKTYFMRESVRTVQGTANRLLCVISESDSLMAVPPFLPKKPPNWFARQMPTRRCLRR